MLPGEGTPLGRADFAAMVEALKATVATTIAEALKTPALLRDIEARRYVGLRKSAWFRAKAAGKLPKPVDPGDGVLRYRRTDLDAYIARLRPGRFHLRRDDAA